MKKLLFGSLLASVTLICWPQATQSQPYTFGTFLGSPSNPGNDDGTNAAAQFTSPTGLALDTSGVILVVDGNAVRKITVSGTDRVVRTLVGDIGLHSFSDGTNGAARFNYPQGVAVDVGGTIYVADTYNNAIRKVARVGSDWVVTTIAGAAPPMSYPGSADGSNNVARFRSPYGIAVDSATNLYVADSLHHTIRKIRQVGINWVVTTLAGTAGTNGVSDGTNTLARFNTPVGVAVDPAGPLYVADFGNNTIRKLIQFGSDWAVTTLAGSPGPPGSQDGAGSTARFDLPQSIAVDNAQNLFVTDSGNNTIRKITAVGVVTTLAGAPGEPGSADGTGSTARFSQPYGIVVTPTGILYVADYLGYSIRRGELAVALRYSLTGQQLVLSWSSSLQGFVPEVATSVPSGSWTPLATNNIALIGQFYVLTINSPQSPRYYRLHKQIP